MSSFESADYYDYYDHESLSPEDHDDLTFKTWAYADDQAGWISAAGYIVYGLTFIPVWLAYPFITIVKLANNIFLLYDVIVSANFLLSYKYVDDDSIVNWSNFYAYTFRRWLVDFLLSPLYYFTQGFFFFNWILNLIPWVLSEVNLFWV